MYRRTNSIPSEVFRFDRRQFTKLCGGAALGIAGSTLIDMDRAVADGLCEKVYDIQDNRLKQFEAGPLQYWIDGRHLNELSNLPSRANLVLFLEFEQKDGAYVETVLLADKNNKTIGSRYFDASDKLLSGFVPYVIFENISLVYSESYFIYYQVRKGTETLLYRFILQNAQRSYLNARFLPDVMKADFAEFMGDNIGLPTSPLQYYTQNGIDLHTARGYIKDVGSDGNFSIDIELMHADVDDGHYMRYFIVTDPVGRLLGVSKRKGRNDNSLVHGSPSGSGNAVTVSQMTSDDILKWNILPRYVADIRDCPYIQIYTEDVFDALARSTIRLR